LSAYRKAVDDAAPEQIKKLLASIIDDIVVESRACIQPYFVWLGVRMLEPSRRRTWNQPAQQLITGALVLKAREGGVRLVAPGVVRCAPIRANVGVRITP
jgi:hypothetical protein